MPALLLVLSACAGAALLAPALPILAALRLLVARLPPRVRTVARFVLLIAAYVGTFEFGALLAAARLRIRGRHLPPALGHPFRTASEHQLRRFTAQFVERGLPLAGLRIHTDIPLPALPSDRPILLIARHAGFLNAQLLTYEITNTLGHRLLGIAKLAIRAAPGFGALIQGTLLTPYRWNLQGRTCALRRMIALARAATPGNALLLFPEGTNATAARRENAIDRLHAEKRPDRAARYRRLRHVLPPQTTGVRAVLTAAPHADVLFYAHTGLEDLLTPLVDLGYPPLADGALHTAWWHVPAERIPREQAAFETWLDDWWQTINTWIASVRSNTATPREATLPLPHPPATTNTYAAAQRVP